LDDATLRKPCVRHKKAVDRHENADGTTTISIIIFLIFF
jgi:hypothetical protein